MQITIDELKNVANQIRIYLNEDEIVTLHEKMNKVLDYVSVLNKYEFEDATTKQMTEGENRFREDIVKPSISLEDALLNAPRKNENFFKVPKVIENE